MSVSLNWADGKELQQELTWGNRQADRHKSPL